MVGPCHSPGDGSVIHLNRSWYQSKRITDIHNHEWKHFKSSSLSWYVYVHVHTYKWKHSLNRGRLSSWVAMVRPRCFLTSHGLAWTTCVYGLWFGTHVLDVIENRIVSNTKHSKPRCIYHIRSIKCHPLISAPSIFHRKKSTYISPASMWHIFGWRKT